MASSVPWNAAVIVPASSWPPNSEMSAPAAKTRSPPVITTAPGRSAASSSAASCSSRSNAPESASTLPLANVMTATLSSRRSRESRSAIAPVSFRDGRPSRNPASGGRIRPIPFPPRRNTHGDVHALFALMSRQHGVASGSRPASSASTGGPCAGCSVTAPSTRRARGC